MNDEQPDLARLRTAAAVKAEGRYIKFNNGPHLCVDVPDGDFTITARTSDGKRVTFAFCPYEEAGVAQCCDVSFADSGVTRPNGDEAIPVQAVLGFTVGHTVFTATLDQEEPCTLVAVLLQTEADRRRQEARMQPKLTPPG